jgi:hypothetical protein
MKMRRMSLEEVADYLESAKINRTINFGHAIVHEGTSAVGFDFVLMVNAFGDAMLTEGM